MVPLALTLGFAKNPHLELTATRKLEGLPYDGDRQGALRPTWGVGMDGSEMNVGAFCVTS